MTDDLESWIGDFENIKRNLVYLAIKRLLHQSHVSRISGREMRDGTAIVHRWMQENYADSMLIGLRRMLDDRRGSFSLIRVLRKLVKRGFSFESYAEICENKCAAEDVTFVKACYWTFSTDGRTLDKSRIQQDIERTLASYRKIKLYVDTKIAHTHNRKPEETSTEPLVVTWDELDKLFEEVVELFNRYYKLVKPGVYFIVEPVLPAGYEQAFDRMLQNHDGQQTSVLSR